MRDVLILALVFGGLPVAFFRPFWGLVLFTWLAYMRPTNLAWGLAHSLELSQWVAVVTLLGLGLAALQERERLMVRSPQGLLLILLGLWVGVSVVTAVDPGLAWPTYSQFLKVLLIALVTTGLVREESRFRVIILTTAVSLGLLGLKYGVFGLLRGGARFDHGPGGFMADNNLFALALNMGLPLLVAMALIENSKLLRVGGLVLAFFTALTVIFTFSRGGFLTLGVVVVAIVLRSGRKLAGGMILLLFIGGFILAPTERVEQDYIQRVQTITEYQEDGSAMGRLEAWKVALEIFKDHPILGVGPGNFENVYGRYGDPERSRVTHNAFLQLLAECGLPAVLLLLALLVVSWVNLGALRRNKSHPKWIRVYSAALQVSILAFIVGGSLLDRAFYDLTYHLIALGVCLGICAGKEAEPYHTEEPATARPSSAEWWREPASARTTVRVP